MVSIPQGTIKRVGRIALLKKMSVSIPQGTIKSGGAGGGRQGARRFQFHKVRLKERYRLDEEAMTKVSIPQGTIKSMCRT